MPGGHSSPATAAISPKLAQLVACPIPHLPRPATYDELDGGAAAESLGFPALRQQLLAQARGDVLETAVGTGLNLPLYNLESGALTSLTAIDLSGGMLAQARRRAEQLGLGERTQLELVQVRKWRQHHPLHCWCLLPTDAAACELHLLWWATWA